MGAWGYFPGWGVKWQQHYTNHLPPSSAEIKNEWSYSSTSPYNFMLCIGTNMGNVVSSCITKCMEVTKCSVKHTIFYCEWIEKVINGGLVQYTPAGSSKHHPCLNRQEKLDSVTEIRTYQNHTSK
jgi:hypothetical protein